VELDYDSFEQSADVQVVKLAGVYVLKSIYGAGSGESRA
jgi:hypothetical protein